jgi:hypothetical protein
MSDDGATALFTLAGAAGFDLERKRLSMIQGDINHRDTEAQRREVSASE